MTEPYADQLRAVLTDDRLVPWGEIHCLDGINKAQDCSACQRERAAVAAIRRERFMAEVSPLLTQWQEESAALRRERDRETELRRSAEEHVRSMQEALGQKPYADEYDNLERDLAALREAAHSFLDAAETYRCASHPTCEDWVKHELAMIEARGPLRALLPSPAAEGER